jgi:hypothetical protein
MGTADLIYRWGVAEPVSRELGMVRMALGESHSEP